MRLMKTRLTMQFTRTFCLLSTNISTMGFRRLYTSLGMEALTRKSKLEMWGRVAFSSSKKDSQYWAIGP